MFYRYAFTIRSYVHLDSAIHFSHRDFTFRFVPTAKRLTGLMVETSSVTIPLPSKRAPARPGEIPTFVSPPEPFRPVVEQEVRAMRGALALWGVIDIDVDQPKVEFLPETDEEKSRVDVLGIALTRRPREELPTMPPVPDMLIRCAIARQKFGEYEIPLEFYRRGCDDCYHQRYIEAVVNFFFVLEYLFSEGKYKSRKLKTNFVSSEALKTAVAEASAQARKLTASPQCRTGILSKYCGLSFDKAVEEFIRLRGFLHHQSLKRKENWNPSVQREFEIDGRFLQLTCQSVLSKICLDILYAKEAKEEFLATPVFDQANRRVTWIPGTLDD
jgi:hypothetical protein